MEIIPDDSRGKSYPFVLRLEEFEDSIIYFVHAFDTRAHTRKSEQNVLVAPVIRHIWVIIGVSEQFCATNKYGGRK